MMFSVIIPVYNVAPYLRECLDSVRAQTCADWEAVCVDDGSTDGSGAILEDYHRRDARFKVAHRSNAGVSVARNMALDVISGEWFLFLDGDDLLRPDALERIGEVIGSERCDGVLFNPYHEYLRKGRNGLAGKPFDVIGRMADGFSLMTGRLSANGQPFGRIYRRSVFGHLRFPDGISMMEDIYYWTDAIGVPAAWVVVKGSYYLYRVRKGSASQQDGLPFCDQIARTASHVVKRLKELGADDEDVCDYWRQYRHGFMLRLFTSVTNCNVFDETGRQARMRIYRSVSQIAGCDFPSFRERLFFAFCRVKLGWIYCLGYNRLRRLVKVLT